MAALLIISTLSGLIVWWPLTGKWRQALTLKSKASFTRLNFDLHKTGGFYSAIVLVVVFFSGLFMNMPERVIPLIELFSPTSFRYGFKSTPQPNLTPIGMAEAVAITDRLYPDGRSDWLYSGIKKDGTYSVCKKDIHTAHSFLDRRCVVLDKYTGKTLDIDDPSRDSGGDVFIQWQWGLHSGQAFGWTGRILIFLSGLVCPLLFVTGVIRWWQKRIAANTKRHFA
jgi:uncharacterized iron-regulated membrane protein